MLNTADLVEKYLKHRDYAVLNKNWSCNKGSIDLVAMDPDGILVFVIANQDGEFSYVGEGVDSAMRAIYETIAIRYVASHPDLNDAVMRFDIIELVSLGDDDRYMVRHHVNAFSRAS